MDQSFLTIHQLPGGVILTNTKGTIVDVNKKVSDLFGFTDKELIEKSLQSLAMPYEKEKLEMIMNPDNETPYKVEIDFYTSEKQKLILELRWKRITIDQHELILFQAYNTTHFKRVKDELNEQRRIHKTLIHNLPGMVYRCKNDVSRTMEYISHHCHELTGYNPEDIIENQKISFNELIHPDHRKSHWDKWQFSLKNQEVFIDEYPIITATGDEKWVWEQGVGVFDENSKLSALEGIIIDITERVQTQLIIHESEQKLKKQNEEYYALNEELIETNKRIKEINNELMIAKEKAEESERLKSAFLANMSHEVRTPMNGILGFSQLIMNPDLSFNERSEYVTYIYNCGNQLLTIINDLIDISKIQSNLISIKPEQVNLNDLLHEQYLLFKPKADSLNLNFSYTKGLPQNHCSIVIDGIRLRQILTNLIGNSFKFTSKGHIIFGYNLRNLVIEFFVEDTGVGISHDMQNSIFERFRQVETDLSRQSGGTGLGLAISKALISKMGGEIWVESTPNFGSKFFFTLPYKPVSDEEPIAAVYNESGRYQNMKKNLKTILIAEDNEINYLFLKQLLMRIDAQFLWVKNGLEVVELVKNNPNIDVILMDIKMPLMDGYEATREVKKIRKDLPIIAQTAYAFESDREKAIEAGCDDYISKPIKRERFVEMMMKYLDR